MIKFENDVYCSINELNTLTGYSKAWLNTILARPEPGRYRMVYPGGKRMNRQQTFRYCKEFLELLAQFRKGIYY